VRLPSPPLLLVTDRRQARVALTEIIKQACAGGCRWISVREKDLPQQEQAAIVDSLRPILREYSACCTIHGSACVAYSAKADGVHLSSGSDPLAAREALGAQALIGLSVHHASEMKNLPAGAVNYVIAGPAYETASKPGYGPALGTDGIAAFAAASDVPVIAIGGITPQRVPEMMRAGAAGVAVMGTVMRASEPKRQIEQMLDALAARGIAR
jgi:thiamine-phosphate pyrophosphorylase